MIDQNIIEITDGNHSVGIQPGFGGSIAYWRVDNDIGAQDILRTTSPSATQDGVIFDTAAFPLVPFSNRIAGSSFNWNGQQITLAPNHPASSHAIHGMGFQSQWSLEESDKNSAAIKLDYDDPQHWPWSFVAVQNYFINNGCLQWKMTLENNGAAAMPAGLGFHPYFAGQDAQLVFDAKRVWINDATNIPFKAISDLGNFDFSDRKTIAGQSVDNCFDGWGGIAEIFWPVRGKKLIISANSDVAILYIPQNGDHFCFEPVNHVTNAINCKDEDIIMPSLAPGEVAALSVKLQYL